MEGRVCIPLPGRRAEWANSLCPSRCGVTVVTQPGAAALPSTGKTLSYLFVHFSFENKHIAFLLITFYVLLPIPTTSNGYLNLQPYWISPRPSQANYSPSKD